MTVLLLTADISRGRLDIRSDMLMMAVLLLTAYIHPWSSNILLLLVVALVPVVYTSAFVSEV